MALPQHLAELEAAGLIRLAPVAPDLAYLFRHGLIHQAARGSLVRADRRRLHRLAGETLEALYPDQLDALAPVLALHFSAAGERARAIAYHRRAARLAQARYANAEALQQLQAALALLDEHDPPPLRAAVHEEAGDAHGLLGEPSGALAHFHAALALTPAPPAEDPPRLVRLHRKVIEMLTAMTGTVPVEQLEAALHASAPSLTAGPALAGTAAPHAETVRLLGALAEQHARAPIAYANWQGDLDSAEQYAAQAVALAEPLDDPLELSTALGVLAGVLYVRGRLRERLAVTQRRQALAAAFADPREQVEVLIDAGAALAEVGEYAQAITLLQQAEQQAAAVRAGTARLYALRLMVQCWFGLDRWDAMLAAVDRCQALAAELTPEQSGPLCFELALSAAVHALRGQAATAQAEREASYSIMITVGGPVEIWGRQQHYWLSVPLAAEGEFALSRATLESGLDKWFSARLGRISTPAGDQDLLAWLADIAGQQEDAEALARFAPRAAEAAARAGHRPYAAMAERALGVGARLAGRYAAAAAHLNAALSVFTALGTRWQAGRTRFELGALAEVQAQTRAAREHYAAALNDFEALGAAPMAARVQGRLQNL